MLKRIKLRGCDITYTEIVHLALGGKFLKIFKVIIAFVQFQFTISQVSFVIEAMRSTIAEYLHGDNKSNTINQENAEKDMLYFYVSLAVLTVYGPLTWVHKI